ncbi:MAG: nuclear transport factor 2 family protein [Terriglobales bacterium]
MTNLDAGLRLLLDRQAIADTFSRYAIGVDTRDWDLYRSSFVDEFEFDYTSFDKDWIGRTKADDFVAGVKAVSEGFDSTQHLIVLQRADIDGDQALCVAYVQARAVVGDKFHALGGYYTHQLRRDRDQWKIAVAKLTVTWEDGDRAVFAIAAKRAQKAAAGA